MFISFIQEIPPFKINKRKELPTIVLSNTQQVSPGFTGLLQVDQIEKYPLNFQG